jgi:hypothetical protein
MGGSTSRLTACSLLGGRGTGGTSSRSSGPEMNGQQSEAAQEFAGRWRGAALGRDQGPRIFFPGLGRPKHWVKQAAPANYPPRCFVQRSVRIGNFARPETNQAVGRSREPPV